MRRPSQLEEKIEKLLQAHDVHVTGFFWRSGPQAKRNGEASWGITAVRKGSKNTTLAAWDTMTECAKGLQISLDKDGKTIDVHAKR